MHIVLDSNTYIFGFGLVKVPACEKVILKISENPSVYILRISRTIAGEVRENLALEDFQKFIRFITGFARIDEDFVIPFELGVKYESDGLKPADAFIAAYAEWTGADVLVTENRHFLTRRADLPFKVLTALARLRFLK